MKIITDNVAYVQKNDIACLNQTDLVIPASIFMKVFGYGRVIIDDSNRYEFFEFEAPEEIEFFKVIDWMIDYNEVKDLSEEETIALGQSIVEEKNSIAQRFNSMTPEERKNNISMVSQCELLDFKIHSLRDVLWFKQGHIKMELPEGVDLQDLNKKKVLEN
ncbi:MAG: hypothetical protein J6B89_02310 [Bacilli bacterium]|nr:hypothetical protein [Bacilli bacterium]